MSIQYCDECDKYIDTDYDSEHFNEDGECIELNKEEVRTIECDCGMWEEFPADQQRHHSQTFEWIKNLDSGEAIYKCPDCRKEVKSQIIEKE